METETLLSTNKLFTSQPGFQSTSLTEEAALNFAKPPENAKKLKEFVSVILKIEMKKNKNFFVFDENTHAFPEESEALL